MRRAKKRGIEAVAEDPSINLPKKKKQKVAEGDAIAENGDAGSDWLLLAGANVPIITLHFALRDTKSSTDKGFS